VINIIQTLIILKDLSNNFKDVGADYLHLALDSVQMWALENMIMGIHVPQKAEIALTN
jgi:hypothetical protein